MVQPEYVSCVVLFCYKEQCKNEFKRRLFKQSIVYVLNLMLGEHPTEKSTLYMESVLVVVKSAIFEIFSQIC